MCMYLSVSLFDFIICGSLLETQQLIQGVPGASEEIKSMELINNHKENKIKQIM